MQISLKNIVLAGALLGASAVGAGQASAMPVAPGASISTQSAPIELAGWRCGSPYLAMNAWGRCVPVGGPRPYYGPRPIYRPYYRPVYRY